MFRATWGGGRGGVRPLVEQNVEAELSYAYLHAVASAANMGCKLGSRHDDNNGIDAELTAWGPFQSKSAYLQEVDIKIQLKATTNLSMHPNGTHWRYFFRGVDQYN
ncbi:MAG: DUF4365 domain-containing protein, partial [Acetobacteraceae bacterium]|nr:DUF4365 domain-containing protein [Acetobacteraceae bacterium]